MLLLRHHALNKTIASVPNIERIREAVREVIENPYLNNREIGRRLNISETNLRRWKKLPIWEQIRHELLTERAEIIKATIEKDRMAYQQDLEEKQKTWQAFRKALETNGAYSLTLSNNAYKEAVSSERDSLKACSKATKSGAQVHSRNGMEVLKTLAMVDDQLYQNKVLIEYFENLEKEQTQEISED